ncbi:DUF927 domain-containing protein [Candidatus Methylocalor cossyra]|uniref:DUF927 domain-containing protein n=1 Tax=Candidatus Methylocalor cossyra TaxID=3108543 RepID=A0ABP1CCF3_9GAMM
MARRVIPIPIRKNLGEPGEPGEPPELARAAMVPPPKTVGEPGEPLDIGGGTIDPLTDPTGAAGQFPAMDKRPCYAVYDDWCGPAGKRPPGVYHHGVRLSDDPPSPVDTWVCSPIHIEAVTCTERHPAFGRLLRYRDTYGRWRTWAMPMELLRGSCEELRGELLSAGITIDYRARGKLAEYLLWRTPTRRVLAATRTGWTDDGRAFVLPEAVIGDADVHYMSEAIHHDGAASAGGDSDAWRADVAARCVGNPVLALAVCVALAGPLLARVHRDSGGVHFVGDSSTGKTTALHVAASVWGGDTFRRTWRATANGLEGAAAALSDTCLCLDEIGEADPRDVGAIVYSLGNGTGKSRATRIGSARHVHRWRLTVLSTGERTLAAHMAEGGRTPKAGQMVRLLDIPAARTHGVFDRLHGAKDGRALADTLKTACGRHYGHAGPAFVAAMIRDGRDYGAELAEIEALPQFRADDPQAARAASRFAVFALAGELASEWGILPWPAGEAITAAAELFAAWRAARGTGATEDRQILRAVADFLARHGDSRFSAKGNTDAIVRDRAGWWTDTPDGRVYLFTAAGLREAIQGHDFARALAALESAGWIVAQGAPEAGHAARRARKTDIGGGRKLSLYWILPTDMEGDQ